MHFISLFAKSLSRQSHLYITLILNFMLGHLIKMNELGWSKTKWIVTPTLASFSLQVGASLISQEA